ncbi:MAG: hypothetical protein B7Y47_15260 [Sphingomonas sp. 28-63-12]|nr:MAG: hypothetical protein B7Y47_15260 [Sphingomonas sp. 28-63-12]
MTLQAYIDDSVDGSGIYVLAGYISSAQRWAAFAKEWEERLPLSVLQEDGSFRFKMSEMARFGRMENVSAFHNVIARNVQMSVACVINKYDLEHSVDSLHVSIQQDNVTIPANIEHMKDALRDPFYFTFRVLMDAFHLFRVEAPQLFPLDDVVDFYFDETTSKARVQRTWGSYIENRDEKYRSAYGVEPRFEDDTEFLPIQAADFWAWWVRKWALEYGPGHIEEGRFPFPTIESPTPNLVIYIDKEKMVEALAGLVGPTVQKALANNLYRFARGSDGS